MMKQAFSRRDCLKAGKRPGFEPEIENVSRRGEPSSYPSLSSYEAFAGGIIRDIRSATRICVFRRGAAQWNWLLYEEQAGPKEVLCPKRGRGKGFPWNCRSRFIRRKKTRITPAPRAI